MNGYRTPNEETDLASISQRTENKKNWRKAEVRAQKTHAFSCEIKLLSFELSEDI